MANERTYPCLPCADLDQAISFYEALGFSRKYRQLRPNPYGIMAREDLQIHLFGMPDFDPAKSYGSVIITVPDPDALYRSFAEGLRNVYNKLPIAGIPRILRPRKKFGTVRGFSVVDVGGNWLRVSRSADTEVAQDDAEPTGLAGFVGVAARLGDAHGDDLQALKTIENGLRRFPNAPTVDKARALLYRAELETRLNRKKRAEFSLSEMRSLEMTADDREQISDELAETSRLVAGK